MIVHKVTGLCSCSLKALIFDIEPACIELFPPLSHLPFCLLSLSPLTFLSLTLMTVSARASRLVQLFCSSLCLVCMYSSWCYWRGRAWNISLHWFTPIVKCLCEWGAIGAVIFVIFSKPCGFQYVKELSSLCFWVLGYLSDSAVAVFIPHKALLLVLVWVTIAGIKLHDPNTLRRKGYFLDYIFISLFII